MDRSCIVSSDTPGSQHSQTHHSLCKSSNDLRRNSVTLQDRPTGSFIRFCLGTVSRNSSKGMERTFVVVPRNLVPTAAGVLRRGERTKRDRNMIGGRPCLSNVGCDQNKGSVREGCRPADGRQRLLDDGRRVEIEEQVDGDFEKSPRYSSSPW